MKALRFENDRLYLLDQTRLPFKENWLEFTDCPSIVRALRAGVCSGTAAALAGAYAYVLASSACSALPPELFAASMIKAKKDIQASATHLQSLQYALEYMENTLVELRWRTTACEALKTAALELHMRESDYCRRMSITGLGVVPRGACIMTMGSSGALSSGGRGTALGIIEAAYKAEKLKMAFVCEGRPDLDGSRLAALELERDKVPVTVHTDNAAAVLMQNGLVDLVILPVYTVCGNGDCMCAPGAYNLACLARYHNIPFYISAGVNSIDLSRRNSSMLRFEQLSADRLTDLGDKTFYPRGVKLFNPLGDIIPASMITGIILDKAVAYPPFADNIISAML